MKIQYKDKEIEVQEGKKIQEVLSEEIKASEYAVVGAIFNNEYENLNYEIHEDGKVELIDISSKEGSKIYRRTMVYILAKAFEKLYPNNKMNVDYQLTNSMFCDVEKLEVTEEMAHNLTEEMRRIVREDLPIRQIVMNREEATEFYKEYDTSKGRLQLDLEGNEKIFMYECDGYYNYCYGTIANRTGIAKIFEIVKYENGLLMRYPSSDKPLQLPKLIQTKKLAWALNEYEDIHRILDMDRVYKINKAIEEDRIKDLIMLDEALHEKKIANIASELYLNGYSNKLIFSGGLGKITYKLWNETEAEKFAKIAIEKGVPSKDIYLEKESTNTGDNFRFSKRLIENLKLDIKSCIVVCKPYDEKRAYAAFKKIMPEYDVIIHSENTSCEEYYKRNGNEWVNVLVGDIQRMKLFYEKGWQIKMNIPQNVWNAYEILAKRGYDKFILKDKQDEGYKKNIEIKLNEVL